MVALVGMAAHGLNLAFYQGIERPEQRLEGPWRFECLQGMTIASSVDSASGPDALRIR